MNGLPIGLTAQQSTVAIVQLLERLKQPTDHLKVAITALKNLHEHGVSEHLENEFSTVRIEDWIEELEAVYNYEPDESESPDDFERNGGNGLTAAERNK